MASSTSTALLHLAGIGKTYQSGDETIHALRDVSVSIHAGEFVAIMGQSGSGKSTLMNILGCLDRPSAGQYHINGKPVESLTRDQLATVRRTVFGFVFQRYNLITNADAAENVAMPAIYAGLDRPTRFERARTLLASLGLAGREGNRPSQLSGGQQQRVAIARALVNNPPVILADEPTGALDSKSGREVMQLLTRLHAEGRTIVLITHDEEVAAYAHRVIRIQDGAVLSDTVTRPAAPDAPPAVQPQTDDPDAATINLPEATRLSLRSLHANTFRTLLTLLGIIIGVTSVVTMMAVGNGSRANVIEQISAMGTNLLYVRPGAPNLRSSGEIATLVPADADAIAELPGISAVSPERSGGYTLRYGNTDYATTVQGVGERMPELREWPVASGSFFNRRDMDSYAPVIVLGHTVATNLFGTADPVGRKILVRNVLFEVIGVLAAKGATMMGTDQDDAAFVPVTTGLVRLFGGSYVNSISIKVADSSQIDAAETTIHALLLDRHRTEDFRIRNMSSLLEMASSTQATLTILLGTVAAISLLVGGIGVMNIMLVSVTERTREIGVRMATGARRKDVLFQFLTEAGVVCLIGGLAGVALGLMLSGGLALFGVNILITPWPALLAFASAVATGVVFGFIPARKAAEMDPVRALSSE